MAELWRRGDLVGDLDVRYEDLTGEVDTRLGECVGEEVILDACNRELDSDCRGYRAGDFEGDVDLTTVLAEYS